MTPPVPMDAHEKMRLRAAAFRVSKLLPGPLGELVSRELLTWEEFGYRLGNESIIRLSVDQILKSPLPEESPNPSHKAASARQWSSAVGYGG